jgi:hypothetical protein
MAATHTYVITSATAQNGVATIVGTVDTIPSTGVIPVTLQASLGDILSIYASGGVPAQEAFISPLIISAAVKLGLPVPAPVALTQISAGSFSINGITYVISSATAIGDLATIVGTVNGAAVTINMSPSNMSVALAVSLATLQANIAAQMLRVAISTGFTTFAVTQLGTGTFTF